MAGPTALPCPVCHVPAGRGCLSLIFQTLPTVHPERTEATPLYDELLGTLSGASS